MSPYCLPHVVGLIRMAKPKTQLQILSPKTLLTQTRKLISTSMTQRLLPQQPKSRLASRATRPEKRCKSSR